MDSDLTCIRYGLGADPGAETQGCEGGDGRADKREKGGKDRGAIVFGVGGGQRGAKDTEPGALTLSSCDPWGRRTF